MITTSLLRASATAATLALSTAPAAAQRLPLSFGTAQVMGRGVELGSIIAAQVSPDGGAVAVDHLNARIVAFDPEGRVRWSVGRRGRGPGEFTTPYRVDVRRDGSVLVYRSRHHLPCAESDWTARVA